MVCLSVALPARAEKFSGTGNPTLTTGDAPDSICPSGWRMSGYEGNKSYNNLVSILVSRGNGANIDTVVLASPISFPRSGYYFYNGSPSSTTQGGSWVARYNRSTNGHYLLFDGNYLLPQYSYGGGRGFTLRCLAR